MEPGVGQGGHVARRRLDAATIGAAAPRGGNAAPAHWVHCGPLGRRSTVDTGSPGLTDLAAPAPWSRRVLRTGRVAQPPSGRHGPHFPRRSVDATPTSRGPARPTTVRTLWCCPLWTVRSETAVPSYPRGTARLLTRLRRLVGGEPAYRRVVPVRTIGPPARPPGRVPRPPCRLIPVGRHGSYPPRRPLRRRGVETAVSPCPRGTAPDRPRRPRAERPEAAVSSQPRGPARRLVRRAAAGRRGSDRRVALGGGRRATRPEPPRRSLRPGSGAARTAVPSSLPRTARLPTTAVPRGAARTAVSLRVARRSGWCGTTVPAGVHPPAARCLPQPCALGRISQALTKRCCRAVTLDRCSG